jgi:hypothetical protein
MKTTSVINQQIETLSKTLFSEILGFDRQGGTLNFDSEQIIFTGGYLVSRKSPSIILDRAKFAELTVDQLNDLLKNLYFKATSNDYLGFWQNSNKVYIDLSLHILNKSQAIQFGLGQQQIAIFDCNNQKSINLEKYSF